MELEVEFLEVEVAMTLRELDVAEEKELEEVIDEEDVVEVCEEKFCIRHSSLQEAAACLPGMKHWN
jgi:hypothetical protein